MKKQEKKYRLNWYGVLQDVTDWTEERIKAQEERESKWGRRGVKDDK